jgi:hypothetical protein
MMKTSLAASLFRIRGLEDCTFKLRTLRVRNPVPRDNHYAKRMQQWADILWRRLKCPVFAVSGGAAPEFLVPAEFEHVPGELLTIVDVPSTQYEIEVTNEIAEVRLADAQPDERSLSAKMIDRIITDKLLGLSRSYWRREWTLFHRMQPENRSEERDAVNAYRGFKFATTVLDPGDLFLACDVRTTYIGKRNLLQHSEEERTTFLHDHLSTEIDVKERATFLRDNGPKKIPCRFVGYTSQTIGDFQIKELGKTIFEYYQANYPRLGLDRNDPAVWVQDRAKDVSLAVPASALFPVFTTEEEVLRICSIKPFIGPEERVQEVQRFLSDLKGIVYHNKPVQIEDRCLTKPQSIFAPPTLEFGAGEKLEPFANDLRANSRVPSIDDAVSAIRLGKMSTLQRAGPFTREALPDVVFFYPDDFPRRLREQFIENLNRELVLQTGSGMNIVNQRFYRVGPKERRGNSLLYNIRSAQEEHSGFVLALVVLWNGLSRGIYEQAKEALRNSPSQFVTDRVARQIADSSDPQQSRGRGRNLALGVLTASGVQPWVLADELHHDVYLGIDVLHGRVGYNFLSGKGGRHVRMSTGASVKRGRIYEALNKGELRSKIEKVLREIRADGDPIRSFIIHRDGRWWPRESQALHGAVSALIEDGTLERDCRVGVVEIRKSHLPVRLYTLTETPGSTQYGNPLPGSHLQLDERRALLSTTGRPRQWDRQGRTAGTILLNLIESTKPLSIAELTEDAYRLTHLNWSAPEIEISAPVTIRWNDDALRVSLQNINEDESSDETEKIIEEVHS